MFSGGSSMYPELPSRLEKELKQLLPTRMLGGDPARLSVERECPTSYSRYFFLLFFRFY